MLALSLSPAALDQPFTRPRRLGPPQPDLNVLKFLLNGAATTMRAIAGEVGVATGNAYYYFGSKEELIQTRRLLAVVDEVLR